MNHLRSRERECARLHTAHTVDNWIKYVHDERETGDGRLFSYLIGFIDLFLKPCERHYLTCHFMSFYLTVSKRKCVLRSATNKALCMRWWDECCYCCCYLLCAIDFVVKNWYQLKNVGRVYSFCGLERLLLLLSIWQSSQFRLNYVRCTNLTVSSRRKVKRKLKKKNN